MRHAILTFVAVTLAPALATAQPAPTCFIEPGVADAAYSAAPIITPGCDQPARYDVSIVGGCVGVYGAQELSIEGGIVTAAGPGWSATIDARGVDLLVTPSCAGAVPVALAPVSALETSSVARRAALLDDSRPDVRAAALEATARDQGSEGACAALSAFLVDAPSYGFAREADAGRARALARKDCVVEPPTTLADASTSDPPPTLADVSTPEAPPTWGAPEEDPRVGPGDDQWEDAPGEPSESTADAFVSEEEDTQGSPDEPGGVGYSFNVGWLIGDRALGSEPAISMWGGVKVFPDDEDWGAFFAPGLQLTLADTRVEVVPTLRFGMAYLLSDELEGGTEALVRTFTAVEIYGILGIKPPIGNDDIGVRAGLGITSPLGLLVSLASLSELELPLPNGLEVHLDQDMITNARTWRMNLTVGF